MTLKHRLLFIILELERILSVSKNLEKYSVILLIMSAESSNFNIGTALYKKLEHVLQKK